MYTKSSYYTNTITLGAWEKVKPVSTAKSVNNHNKLMNTEIIPHQCMVTWIPSYLQYGQAPKHQHNQDPEFPCI